jgi:hypothetical protein
MQMCTQLIAVSPMSDVLTQVIEQLDAAGDLPEVADALGASALSLTDRQKRVRMDRRICTNGPTVCCRLCVPPIPPIRPYKPCLSAWRAQGVREYARQRSMVTAALPVERSASIHRTPSISTSYTDNNTISQV